MPEVHEFISIMKKAALDAVEASKPVNVYFGKTVSISPLKINVEQKMILGEKQLILSERVTDFETMVTVDQETEKKKITVHNGLVVGDEVLLIRLQGGQEFLVIDRAGKT